MRERPAISLRAVQGAAVAVLFAAASPLHGQGGATYRLAAFSGQPAPGLRSFGTLEAPVIGNGGALAFSDYQSDYFTENENAAVWAGPASALALVVAAGDRAPGSAGLFSGFGPVAVNAVGRVAFDGFVSGEVAFSGLWASTPAGLALALRVGGSLPNKLSSADVSKVGPPVVNAEGVLAVKALLKSSDPDPVAQRLSSALLAGRPEELTAILAEGDAAPGFPEGTSIRELSGPEAGRSVDLNDRGKFVFKATVGGLEGDPPFGVIYAGNPGDFRVIAAEGTPADGLPDATYTILDGRPSISSNGFVAFVAQWAPSVTDSALDVPRSAIFATGPERQLSPVVKAGDPVPGTTGVVFGAFSDPCVNRTGDVVFSAQIIYPNETSRVSLWLQRLDGPPVLLAASGVKLTTPAGEREAVQIGFKGAGGFNDLHQAAFRAVFADEATGIYVADTRPGGPDVAITRPGSRREQVTEERRIVIAGTAADASGVSKVECTVRSAGDRALRKAGKPKRRTVRVQQAVGTEDWQFRVPLELGENVVTIVATDLVGNTSEPSEITIKRYACEK